MTETPPRLEACYFAKDLQWKRLARVLELTALEQLRGWSIRVEAIDPGPLAFRQATPRTIAANSRKLEHWRELVAQSADGDRLLLIDADTMVLRPLDAVWSLPTFDVAYTVRASGKRDFAGGKFPLNGGVIFLRISPAVRAFIDRWLEENSRMLRDRIYHLTWQKRYGGINQAAFGALLEGGALADLQTVALDCREWNAEDSAWPTLDLDVARILHVKSALRLACFFPAVHRDTLLEPIANLWRAADGRAYAAAQTARRPA